MVQGQGQGRAWCRVRVRVSDGLVSVPGMVQGQSQGQGRRKGKGWGSSGEGKLLTDQLLLATVLHLALSAQVLTCGNDRCGRPFPLHPTAVSAGISSTCTIRVPPAAIHVHNIRVPPAASHGHNIRVASDQREAMRIARPETGRTALSLLSLCPLADDLCGVCRGTSRACSGALQAEAVELWPSSARVGLWYSERRGTHPKCGAAQRH